MKGFYKIFLQLITGIIAIKISFYVVSFFLIGVALLIGLIFIAPSSNPTERNYITFKEINKDIIFDSLYQFMEMTKSFPFPKDTSGSYTIEIQNCIGNNYKEFRLNKELVGEYKFADLRNCNQFQDFSDEQIRLFLNLYKYLYNKGIAFEYYIEKHNIYSFRYKDLYLMYGEMVFVEQYDRFLKYFNGKKVAFSYTIPLDYYRGFYLTCNDKDTISKNIPYKILKKFKK